ncbi:MAG: nickel pincer cofactor biosynthesis protein LarC [Leptolyngbyaceae cyanobacterium SM2_3_12]|nr:nickel pincer cofactor biosynthesis protein LarC [Leptolyngbyaceae cyanobacterium SM2_3_12]
MKTIAYLDCPSGISGDMCLAALVDAGVPLAYLQSQLATLGLGDEFTLSASSTRRQGLRAVKAHVVVAQTPLPIAVPSDPSDPGHGHPGHGLHGHPHPGDSYPGHPIGDGHPPTPAQGTSTLAPPSRNWPAIQHLITQAALPQQVQDWSLKVFRHLAEAEAAVHGIAIDQVHFHEVGATDAIVDIVGTCLGLDYLNIDRLICSPLPVGRGRVKAAHGWLPVPAPAVLKLLEQRQVPIYSNGLEGELVTPTGAAIVTALAQGFGDPPAFTLQHTGLGAGGKDLPIANILRLWVGTTTDSPGSAPLTSSPWTAVERPLTPHSSPAPSVTPGLEAITVLETQVDDMVPQGVGYLYERLLNAGALDVFTQPIAMKKSRPGLLITVICHPKTETICTEILWAETPTLGIRHRQQWRRVLDRVIQPLTTPHGTIAMKLAYQPQTQILVNVHPEYEDCAALARQLGLPWTVIYQTALTTWYNQNPRARK